MKSILPAHSNVDAIASVSAKHLILSQWLHQLGQTLKRCFGVSSELKVWCTCDRAGHVWWHVYDPCTERFLRFDSEANARIWIDTAYRK